jgi:hypothetical protein
VQTARDQINHLNEQWLVAVETRIEADLAMPAPLHTLAHSLTLQPLSLTDRAHLVAAAGRLCSRSTPDDPRLDGVDVRRLGRELGFDELAFRLVFEPLTWIGFFLAPDELSAAAYVGALRFLIGGRSNSWRALWLPSPNGETLVRPLASVVARYGATTLDHGRRRPKMAARGRRDLRRAATRCGRAPRGSTERSTDSRVISTARDDQGADLALRIRTRSRGPRPAWRGADATGGLRVSLPGHVHARLSRQR